MPDATPETLTTALRRLADEGGSDLLMMGTAGGDVEIVVESGRPVSISPVLDVSERVGVTASAGVRNAAAVDVLLGLVTDALLTTDGVCAIGGAASTPRIDLPPGLGEELARRAADASAALDEIGEDGVVVNSHRYEAAGEAGRVQRLLDGEHTLRDLAAATGLPLSTVARWGRVLLQTGAAVGDGAPAGRSIASGSGYLQSDDREDEPEPWVMGDPAPAPAPSIPRTSVPDRSPAGGRSRDTPIVAPVAAATSTPDDEHVDDVPVPPAPAPVAPVTSTLVSDDVVGDDWADTAWLDELDGDIDSRPPPVTLPDNVAAAPAAPPEPEPEPATQPQPEPSAAPMAPVAPPVKAGPGEIAEFLRELSRLALDDG